jgi:menaquinone-dependent protoporphyrinogen oxidase
MKTAIVYVSNHGTTEKVAQLIKNEMGGNSIAVFNLRNDKITDLAQYDCIIIGGSIHAGFIQKRIRKFCEEQMVILLQKRIALFICCMNEPEAQAEFERAFPELLRSHATSKKIIGGEFLFDKMNFLEKILVKKIGGVTQSVSRIDEGKIRELVNELKDVKM